MERISELPDDLLIRILSFLPVEEIARAKLISKAWQKLSEFSFLPPLTFEQPPRHCNCSISSFIDSIDSSLKLHYQRGLSLSRIRLHMDLNLIGSSRSQINSWIDAALAMKVEQLDLRFLRNSIFDCFHLPSKVFASGTITVLCLEGFRLELGNTNIDLPALRKLRLRHSQCDEEEWIPKLISSFPSIRDLEISRCYPLQKIHVSRLPRTITDLRLEKCNLEICVDTNIDLPALRNLLLREIDICCECHDQAAIQKLISSCPLIHDLEMTSCYGVQGLHVSGLINLQRLSVVSNHSLETLEIDAPSLHYLKYGYGRLPCDLLFITSCEFLRELRLHERVINENLFRNLLSRLPNLERLVITLNLLEKIEISHHHLMRLEIAVANTVREKEPILKIDTPNLQSFIYYGSRIPLISSLPSLNLSSLQEFRISFMKHKDYRHSSIFLKLKEFFQKAKHFHGIKLHLAVGSKEELIIPPKLRPILSPPVYDIKHLSLSVGRCSRYQFIIDRVLWMFHPQILSISRGTHPSFLKVLYNKFMNKEEHPKCCTSCPIKCWQHYLEEVQIDCHESIVHIEGHESIVEIDKMMAMPKLAYIKSDIRFKLRWRARLP